jgi:membrane associated rhomboid family serine protease
MPDGDINYEAYSDFDLRQALLTIDRQRFPRNFRNLQAVAEARALGAAQEAPGAASPPPVSAEVERFHAAIRGLAPRTPVTYALVAVNVAVFAAMAVAGAGILSPNAAVHVAWGSNLVPVTVDGEWWRLGTSMFLHFGLLHLLVNMWVLYANGRLVERLYGSGRFLLLYLFAGLAGSLASAAWHPAVNSAGASGAIFGVLGGMVAFLVARKSRVPREVLRAQGRSVAAFAVYSIAFGFTYPGIDNAAHLGGAAGGFLIGLALARPLAPEARAEPQVLYLAGIVLAAALALFASAQLVLHLKGRMSAEDRYAAAATWFDHGEPRAIAAYNAMVEESGSDRLGDGEFADRLEAEVIGFYAEARERLAWQPDPRRPGRYDAARQRLAKYVDLRFRSMSQFERALRDGNLPMAREAMTLQDESEALAREIRESVPQP